MTDDAERTCAGMNLHGKDIKIFAGNSNKPLAAAMAECLGITLGRSEVGRFSDGEIQVSIQESVRGRTGNPARGTPLRPSWWRT